MSATSWLGPPSRTRSENCNERFTGRPRPIPGDGSTRSTTRSTAETFWSARGSWCAPIVARPASTDRPSPTSRSTASAELLDELAADLKEGRWRPLPARRVFIPKPGRPQERRPLSIPAVRDRVVQAAAKTVIEPIFEADMLECSFGFRPRRSAHDALQVLVDEAWRGRRWVAESDIANCFEAIPHSGLMAAVEERISDRHVLKLLRAMLRAGVMEDGAVTRSDTGTPQGGVLSPCLANVYLHRLDRQWADRGTGVLVRYADDLLAHVPNPAGGRTGALRRSRRSWPSLGLSSSKPRRGSCTWRKVGRGWTSSASTTAGCAATPRARGT